MAEKEYTDHANPRLPSEWIKEKHSISESDLSLLFRKLHKRWNPYLDVLNWWMDRQATRKVRRTQSVLRRNFVFVKRKCTEGRGVYGRKGRYLKWERIVLVLPNNLCHWSTIFSKQEYMKKEEPPASMKTLHQSKIHSKTKSYGRKDPRVKQKDESQDQKPQRVLALLGFVLLGRRNAPVSESTWKIIRECPQSTHKPRISGP